MSQFTARPESPPLSEDANGSLRVGDSNVLLELVLRAFQDGATPEQIVQRYASLKLGDVYAVVGYYLRHADDLNAYLQDREQVAGQTRKQVESSQGDLGEIRDRLHSRRQT